MYFWLNIKIIYILIPTYQYYLIFFILIFMEIYMLMFVFIYLNMINISDYRKNYQNHKYKSLISDY